jgi:hypothetical protein
LQNLLIARAVRPPLDIAPAAINVMFAIQAGTHRISRVILLAADTL